MMNQALVSNNKTVSNSISRGIHFPVSLHRGMTREKESGAILTKLHINIHIQYSFCNLLIKLFIHLYY